MRMMFARCSLFILSFCLVETLELRLLIFHELDNE
jgi:hypothetical protein